MKYQTLRNLQTVTMYCPDHSAVTVISTSSVERCPVCEQALSFSEAEARRYNVETGETE